MQYLLYLMTCTAYKQLLLSCTHLALYVTMFYKHSGDNIHFKETYRETDSSSNPQFENPISMPLNIPIGAIAVTYSVQHMLTLCLTCDSDSSDRIETANTNLIIIWRKTNVSGKWKT